jgi:uncharacterized membrane protein YdjX (TVP38/TMEM64 family)
MPGPNRASDRSPARTRIPLAAVLMTLAAIAALALLVLAVSPLREAVDAALRGDTAEVRESIRDLGIGGPMIVLGLCLVHAFLFYPAEIVDAAAGFVYGFGPGLALVMAGWMLNAWVAYAIGHSLAHPLLQRLMGPVRFRRAEATVARGGLGLLLTIRLIPIVPFSLLSYAAGAARVPLWRYTWTTFVGYLPITAIATYLGSRLEQLHPTHPLVLAAFGLFLLLLLAIRWLSRSIQAEGPVE